MAGKMPPRQPAGCRRYNELWPQLHGRAAVEARPGRSPLICSHTPLERGFRLLAQPLVASWSLGGANRSISLLGRRQPFLPRRICLLIAKL
jgi:hypothetical protein